MSKVATVLNLSMSRDSNNEVRLSIEDDHSGDMVVEMKLTLKELGLLVTGLHGIKADAEVFTDANIAKEREVKSVVCDKAELFSSKEDQGMIVKGDFTDKYEHLGWELQDDGTMSQQNSKQHKYTIKRYVDVENPLDVKRYY